MVSMEIRLYGDRVESDPFYGYFMVKLVWRLSGIFMEKTKLSNNSHINFTIDKKQTNEYITLNSS